MHGSGKTNPYDYRNCTEFGQERGVGMAGKVGTKYSGSSQNASSNSLKKGKPPRKMG